MWFLAILSSLVGLIGLILHVMILQNVSEHLAVVIGHALQGFPCGHFGGGVQLYPPSSGFRWGGKIFGVFLGGVLGGYSQFFAG